MRAKKKSYSMSDTTQAFYLRLNNHKSFMTEALSELYHNCVLVDCTLTAQGGQLRAHQTVLAAASPYFKNIFAEHNRSQYPVIIIKDMPFSDLKAIVDYIYCGEVMIPRQQLQSVLKSGAILQVKGLHEFNVNSLNDMIEWDSDTFTEKKDKECNTSADKQSKDRKSYTKYLKTKCNDSMNACESTGNMSTNKKGTRKSKKSSQTTDNCSSNGFDRESQNCGKNNSSTHTSNHTSTQLKTIDSNVCTNDQIVNNGDDINDNIKREYSQKLMNGKVTKISEKLLETSLEEPSIINSNAEDDSIEKSMTGKPVLNRGSGGSDNIVPLMPFAPLQQPVMIDVKPNVNQASHPSEFCFGFITNTGIYNTATTGAVTHDISPVSDIKTVENCKQQNQSQNELKDQINDINICATDSTDSPSGNQIIGIPSKKQINDKVIDVNQTSNKNYKRCLISAANHPQKRRVVKNRISKKRCVLLRTPII